MVRIRTLFFTYLLGVSSATHQQPTFLAPPTDGSFAPHILQPYSSLVQVPPSNEPTVIFTRLTIPSNNRPVLNQDPSNFLLQSQSPTEEPSQPSLIPTTYRPSSAFSSETLIQNGDTSQTHNPNTPGVDSIVPQPEATPQPHPLITLYSDSQPFPTQQPFFINSGLKQDSPAFLMEYHPQPMQNSVPHIVSPLPYNLFQSPSPSGGIVGALSSTANMLRLTADKMSSYLALRPPTPIKYQNQIPNSGSSEGSFLRIPGDSVNANSGAPVPVPVSPNPTQYQNQIPNSGSNAGSYLTPVMIPGYSVNGAPVPVPGDVSYYKILKKPLVIVTPQHRPRPNKTRYRAEKYVGSMPPPGMKPALEFYQTKNYRHPTQYANPKLRESISQPQYENLQPSQNVIVSQPQYENLQPSQNVIISQLQHAYPQPTQNVLISHKPIQSSSASMYRPIHRRPPINVPFEGISNYFMGQSYAQPILSLVRSYTDALMHMYNKKNRTTTRR